MSSYLWHRDDLANILRSHCAAVSREPSNDYARGRLDALADVATAIGVTLDAPLAVEWIVRDDKNVTAVMPILEVKCRDT